MPMQGAHTHTKSTCPAAASCTALSKLPSSSSPAPGPSVLYAVTPQISKFLSRGETTFSLLCSSQSLIFPLSRGYCWDAAFLRLTRSLPPCCSVPLPSLPPLPPTRANPVLFSTAGHAPPFPRKPFGCRHRGLLQVLPPSLSSALPPCICCPLLPSPIIAYFSS